MNSIIEFKGVKKHYQIGEVTIEALKGVDFTIKKGEFVVILGASGALDDVSGQAILNLLDELNRDLHKTIVLITHNAQIAEMASKVIHIKGGLVDSIF